MRINKFLIALISCALICSCANISNDFKFDPNKATGVVVGSISWESSLARIHLYAQADSGDKPIRLSFGCDLVPCLTPWNDAAFSASDDPKQRAGGYAVEVPEGKYRLVAWEVVRGHWRSTSKAPIDIEFSVERGKVSYIGNLHFDAEWDNVQLRDKASRDLPALKAAYSILRTAPLSYQIASGLVINKVGGEYQTRLKGPIYIPVFR